MDGKAEEKARQELIDNLTTMLNSLWVADCDTKQVRDNFEYQLKELQSSNALKDIPYPKDFITAMKCVKEAYEDIRFAAAVVSEFITELEIALNKNSSKS
ncbi:hypothetical protein [Ligilactobacillus agilis]|uniref:Uncharacterized protein n=1 Tax=Ligilactobacillus agilis TaxID=1601 RepID=A0A6F9Y2F1_9LACO|nr:hypothetical protein [Ligilactobacillus agilis]GET11627.1 hypothetical protein SN811_01270 [Ligilactobacillus agilis]